MALFKKTSNREVSLSKMKKWSEKQQLSKVVVLLEQGNKETKLRTIAFLSSINMINVKRELLKCLAFEDKEIALKTVESLEYMGVTPEEREQVDACKRKWGLAVTKPNSKKEDKGDNEIVFSLDEL